MREMGMHGPVYTVQFDTQRSTHEVLRMADTAAHQGNRLVLVPDKEILECYYLTYYVLVCRYILF